MKTALVKIWIPYQQNEQMTKWTALETKLNELKKNSADNDELAPGIWLFALDNNLPFFALAVWGATSQGLKWKTAILEEEPKWIGSA